MWFKAAYNVLKQILAEYKDDHCPRMAAALAYYTIFSLAPMLVIAIYVSGLIFGPRVAEAAVRQQLEAAAGRETAAFVVGMVDSARAATQGTVATVIGIGVLLFGATGVFTQLQDALNTIWGVKTGKDTTFVDVVRARLLSFAFVVGIGFLLVVFLLMSTVLSFIKVLVPEFLPGTESLFGLTNTAVTFILALIMFGAIFKVLPDVVLHWRDVAVGAAVTAALFTLGEWLIELYLTNSAIASVYGAAGSLMVILLWVFLSAQIFLFGAEFTQVYTRRRRPATEPVQAEPSPAGEPVKPTKPVVSPRSVSND